MKTIYIESQPIQPSKIICVGRNYLDHVNELGNAIPDSMVVFLKPNSAISNQLNAYHQEPLHYEGEICFTIREGELFAVGFGLDLTKRNLQTELKSKSLPWERAKAFDGSAVFGEFVKLPSKWNELSVDLSINGINTQSGHTGMMMYPPDRILAELKTFLTLNDGDILMTGTPKGVGVIHKGDIFSGSISAGERQLVTSEWRAI